MTCPICAASSVRRLEIPHPFFAHLDYTTIKRSGAIGRCGFCQSLFQCVGDDDVAAITRLLGSEAYAQSGQTGQTFFVPEFAQPVTRSFLQAEILRDLVPAPSPTILDIGCHDGQFLVEMSVRFAEATLHGFDPNQNLRTLFPSGERFIWVTDLDALRERFDLISLSHSMMYERDTQRLMGLVRRLLRPDGVVFVQGPNIAATPCHLLLGDQYYYYTPNILKNTLNHFGFTCSLVPTSWFPRELACVARPTAEPIGDDTADTTIDDCLHDLAAKVTALKGLSKMSRVGVLGTTVNAAFVDSVIGDQVSGFFDENPRRAGTDFRGKAVLHPRSLRDADVIVMPYGKFGEQIKRRFAAEYRGRFILI